MRRILRWTEQERSTVVNDVSVYEKGGITGRFLKDTYQGRSIAAIKEKARSWEMKGAIPMRKNPVYAAIEARMIALGYGPEVIKSIISPRKISLSTSLVRDIEKSLANTPEGKVWWLLSADRDGNVSGTTLLTEIAEPTLTTVRI